MADFDEDFVPESREFRFGVVTPEQKHNVEEEYRRTREQLPLLDDVLKRLEARVEATDSVREAIALTERYDDLTRDQALVVLDIVNPILQAEVSFIQERIKQASKKR